MDVITNFRISEDKLKEFKIWCINKDRTQEEVLNILVRKLMNGEVRL